jgi:hypothetical protein
LVAQIARLFEITLNSNPEDRIAIAFHPLGIRIKVGYLWLFVVVRNGLAPTVLI